MTEAEWRSCNDVEALLNHLWSVFPEMEWGDRKPTLLFCACGKSVQHLLPGEYSQLLAAMERGADGLAKPEEMRAASERAERAVTPLGDDQSGLMFSLGYGDLGLFGYEAAKIISAATGTDLEETQERIDAQYSDLVREVFGNPFRGARPSGLWLRDPSVRELAHQICSEGIFECVPELADLLEQAGCKDDEVLDHCREPRTHVRGCWVLDLVLGKT
jgi:hypothetical protein